LGIGKELNAKDSPANRMMRKEKVSTLRIIPSINESKFFKIVSIRTYVLVSP
jgi:hypothetical protein